MVPWYNFSIQDNQNRFNLLLLVLIPSKVCVPIKCTCHPICYVTSVDVRATSFALCWRSWHHRIPQTLVDQMAKAIIEGKTAFFVSYVLSLFSPLTLTQWYQTKITTDNIKDMHQVRSTTSATTALFIREWIYVEISMGNQCHNGFLCAQRHWSTDLVVESSSLLPHIYVVKLCHHWFKLWLVAVWR